MQVLSQQLTTFGIKITLQTPAANTFYANLYAGKYQLAYNAEAGGPTPFYEMRQWLFSKNSAPIGTAASSNWERYSNPTTGALLAQYGTTTSVATRERHGEPGAGHPGPGGSRLVPVQPDDDQQLPDLDQSVRTARPVQPAGLGLRVGQAGTQGIVRK